MQRYPELDFLRTLAVVMMIVYHAAFDLSVFYGWNIDLHAIGWVILQKVTASLFLLLVGMGFAISWARGKGRDQDITQGDYRIAPAIWHRYRKYLRRGLGLLTCGMLVTIVTFIVDPGTYVRFGILHLIATGILLLPFFAWMREGAISLGIGIVLLRRMIGDQILNTSLLIPLGIPPFGFSSVDYFPLLPWFGVILLGFGLGHFLYVRHTHWRQFLSSSRFPLAVLFPGRHALLMYLLHQPLLLLLLFLTLGPPSF